MHGCCGCKRCWPSAPHPDMPHVVCARCDRLTPVTRIFDVSHNEMSGAWCGHHMHRPTAAVHACTQPFVWSCPKPCAHICTHGPCTQACSQRGWSPTSRSWSRPASAPWASTWTARRSAARLHCRASARPRRPSCGASSSCSAWRTAARQPRAARTPHNAGWCRSGTSLLGTPLQDNLAATP
jgi:hypothetical protein